MRFYDGDILSIAHKQILFLSTQNYKSINIGDFTKSEMCEYLLNERILKGISSLDVPSQLNFYDNVLQETILDEHKVVVISHKKELGLESVETSIRNLSLLYEDIPISPYKAYVFDIIYNWRNEVK